MVNCRTRRWCATLPRVPGRSVGARLEPQLVPTVPTPTTRIPIKPKCAVCNQEYEVHDLRPVILCLKCYGDAWNLAHERAKKAEPIKTPE